MSLEVIGKIEQEYKSAKDDFESVKRIEQERKMQHAGRE